MLNAFPAEWQIRLFSEIYRIVYPIIVKYRYNHNWFLKLRLYCNYNSAN